MTSQASMWKLGEVRSNAKGGKFLCLEPLFWQEADPTVDQHALETEPRAMQAWEDGRHLRGAQGGPRLMGGQRERVRGQSREYSIPTALCEEIARAATAEPADRLPG